MTSSIPPSLTQDSVSNAAGDNLRDSNGLPMLPSAKPNGHDTGLAPSRPQRGISVEDWDLMLLAVEARLRKAVGEQLGVLPDTPPHSAALAASLVQAIVLDCVEALEKLHAALKTERHQRNAS